MKPLIFLFFVPELLAGQTPLLSGIINTYTPVVNFICDSSYLQVASAQGFAPDDRVLIIQMQGALTDTSNTVQFGSLNATGSAGHFELNRIDGIAGNVIHLKYTLFSSYDTSGKIQLIRVPEYTDVEINGLSCQAWDGSTGGVLVLEAHNTIDVSGPVNVSGRGFRGGMYSNSSAYDKCHFLHYYYTPNPDSSAAKGEGVALLPADKSFGRGRSGNAGGGGNAHNAGGGGGGNFGAGGLGGFEYPCGNAYFLQETQGIPGLSLAGLYDGARIFMGGGGGAGHSNDKKGSKGGNGGGIAVLIAPVIYSNGQTIFAEGENILGGNSNNDGQGGGGAGGSVLLCCNSVSGSLNVNTRGGRGGNSIFQSQLIGPGGGGGGGVVLLSSNLPGVNDLLTGGIHGVCGPGPHGAEDGQPGGRIVGYQCPQSAIPAPDYFHQQSVALCPGAVYYIGGTAYAAPAQAADTLIATTGCDSVIQYTLTLLPYAQRNELIEFCPGDTVALGGVPYTAPGTVLDTLPSAGGGACDTIVTYLLQYRPMANTAVSIDCTDDINLVIPAGTGSVEVDYPLPAAVSTCPCPALKISLTEGLPPGSLFPVAKTLVCYETADSCGNVATCCFFVTVRQVLPCDSKQIGCMRYDLLQITQNAQLERRYRIQVTNTCANRMLYTAFQLPDGAAALQPANNALYNGQAPFNRQYEVRNPNATPFHSIRFHSLSDSLNNGESDVFEYTLSPQSAPAYIHVTSRLEPQAFYEAHLNTFNCPVQAEHKGATLPSREETIRIFPNPGKRVLFADLSAWAGEQVELQVLDGRGQLLNRQWLTADAAPQAIDLPGQLAGGLYFLKLRTAEGKQAIHRLVLE